MWWNDKESPERGFSCGTICLMATTKRKVGRPTKYDGQKTLDLVDVYLSECVDKYEEWHKTRGEKSDTYERVLNIELPTYEGLAIKLDVVVDTLLEWREQHPEFSLSLAKLLQLQKKVLVSKSLNGEYNPTIAKLILSANHNMVEKKEMDVTSGGKPIEGFNYVAPDEAND